MLDMIITVSKDELLQKLRANRTRHSEVAKAALEGYKDEALALLTRHADAFSAGKAPDLSIRLARPTDHTRDYTRVIGMLEMHQGDVFDLDEDSYRKYVDDDWNWKREFLKMSSHYASESVTSNYGAFDE